MDYSRLIHTNTVPSLEAWLRELPQQLSAKLQQGHGKLDEWRTVVAELPEIVPSSVDLCTNTVRVGQSDDCDAATREKLAQQLQRLHPWRKGPFDVFGVNIDTEWRSDWKWNRIAPHIESLVGRTVLDVGCGNGYYAWRMAGEGARLVIGVDPTLVFVMQYFALRKFLREPPVYVLPLAMEDVPTDLQAFDTVFSMGVLYHRRSPFDHLFELRSCLRPGGELVLETLVIDGGDGDVLVPQGRYARMRNVWFIPSCASMESWLKRAGFSDVRTVDVTQTTISEQRSTAWMRFDSLPDFLHPDNADLTIEGLPAPKRAVFVATNT